MIKSKIYLFFIILLVSSCEKEDMSKYDEIVDKYRKEIQYNGTKETTKKKRRWKIKFSRRYKDSVTTTHSKN